MKNIGFVKTLRFISCLWILNYVHSLHLRTYNRFSNFTYRWEVKIKTVHKNKIQIVNELKQTFLLSTQNCQFKFRIIWFFSILKDTKLTKTVFVYLLTSCMYLTQILKMWFSWYLKKTPIFFVYRIIINTCSLLKQ